MENCENYNRILIKEVSKHKSLWDQTSFDYMNQSLKLDEWTSVAQEMNSTVEEVKKWWKLLKDTFKRQVHSLARKNHVVDWVHYEEMSFLLNGMNNLLLPSTFHSNSKIKRSASAIDLSEINCSASIVDLYEINRTASEINLSENSTRDDCSSSSSRKKIKSHHPQSNNTSGVSSSISSFQSTPMSEFSVPRTEFASEDYYFLMSLLPTFDKMSARHKMQVKIKIMQDVFDAAFNDLTGTSNNNESNSFSSGS